jgi:hypothetical protein
VVSNKPIKVHEIRGVIFVDVLSGQVHIEDVAKEPSNVGSVLVHQSPRLLLDLPSAAGRVIIYDAGAARGVNAGADAGQANANDADAGQVNIHDTEIARDVISE